jgi:four helix bundle protein
MRRAMKNYRDLEAWKVSHAITLAVYRATSSFPKDELFGLTSQLRRAAASIPANVAEGCGREGDAELKRFLNIALGSACELDYHVLLAGDLGYLTADAQNQIGELVLQLRRQLGAFIRRLKH